MINASAFKFDNKCLNFLNSKFNSNATIEVQRGGDFGYIPLDGRR